jgi:hypothetical protein
MLWCIALHAATNFLHSGCSQSDRADQNGVLPANSLTSIFAELSTNLALLSPE